MIFIELYPIKTIIELKDNYNSQEVLDFRIKLASEQVYSKVYVESATRG